MITKPDVTVLTAHAADGTPFFWLGDTAWELSHRLNREEATRHLAGEPGQPWSIPMRSSRTATRSRNPQNILGIRLASGKWTGSSAYATTTAKPTGSKVELLQDGPAYLSARVTTAFDNGRKHALAVGLWAGSHVIELDEEFDLGPDEKYQFKEYKEDRDELAWEWWGWYGDKDGTQETHPNNWVLDLSGAEFQPKAAWYRGEAATEPDKGAINGRGESKYALQNT